MNTIDTIKTARRNSNENPTSIYDIEVQALDGSNLDLSKFKGKHMLFVYVASKCGFTPQYKELQQLSDTYKNELVVVGSPCNQFGGQEPGDSEQIQGFCEINFGVTFPLTEKLHVKGSNQHPLYKWLTSKDLNGKKSSSVKWNFQKYLVSPEGKLLDYYFSITKPMIRKITKYL